MNNHTIDNILVKFNLHHKINSDTITSNELEKNDLVIDKPPVDLFSKNIRTVTSNKRPATVIKPATEDKKSALELRYLESASLHQAPTKKNCPIVKGRTHTFNHTHEYAIHDGFLWFRQKGTTAWQPFYFEGFTRNKTPQFIDCDGTNLIVIDEDGDVYYKKVLEEYRAEEFDFEHNQDLQNARHLIKDCDYVAVDISEKNNWIPTWFSLPVVSSMVHPFTKSRLIIPESSRAVSISHRGRYNDFVVDNAQQHHLVSTGVTTLYVLDENGQDIHKHDPWSPPWAKTIIGLPESAETSFIANTISVSASTIMALGFERHWSTGKLTLKVFTRLADIDTEGGNPGIEYGYFANPKKPDLRVLPFDKEWREHPLHLTGKAMVAPHITIEQTGQGNDAREMFILGKNSFGMSGYYCKKLLDRYWTFIPILEDVDELLEISPLSPMTEQSTVRDYRGYIDTHDASMKNFGQRSNYATIRLELDDKEIICDLYKRLAFATFLGVPKFHYDFVVQSDEPEAKTIFGHEKVFHVGVKIKNDQVVIKSKNVLHPFKFHFTSIKSVSDP